MKEEFLLLLVESASVPSVESSAKVIPFPDQECFLSLPKASSRFHYSAKAAASSS